MAKQRYWDTGINNWKFLDSNNSDTLGGKTVQQVREDSANPLRLEVVSSVVGQTPTAGRMVFSTAEGKAKVGDGSAWL